MYARGFLWLKEHICFSDRKMVGQTLIWVLCIILMITVSWYAFLIDFYLTHNDALMNELLTIPR